MKSPAAGRLAIAISAAGGTVKLRAGGRLKVTGMRARQLAELSAAQDIAIDELTTHSGWLEAAARDKPAWRARAYLVLKLPVSALSLLVAGGAWMGGLVLLTYPIWRAFPDGAPPPGPGGPPIVDVGAIMLLTLAGAGALLAAPWLTRAVLAVDRSLVRGLLGPASLAERMRDLEATRARAVDDAAASSGTCTTAPRPSSSGWP